MQTETADRANVLEMNPASHIMACRHYASKANCLKAVNDFHNKMGASLDGMRGYFRYRIVAEADESGNLRWYPIFFVYGDALGLPIAQNGWPTVHL